MIAAAVLVSGCIPRTYPTAVPGNELLSATDEAATNAPARSAPRQLTPAERQLQELEAQLVERDRAIAAVQNQLGNARQQPSGGATAAPPPPAPGRGESGAGPTAAAASAPLAAAAPAGKDAELADAKHQIATLETRLETEVQRRKQQHEGELRAALAQQDSDGVSPADSVTSLRAENAALQSRLDDEHRQNRELASKLKLAGRVTDLIFKMQSSGATTAATVPQ
ncbi:MAG TPA: hypothetical protein VL049_16485 [Candidatus Dormibacteraeota bacterium]|nr:hypothetical protein [Candidatus Dormibacteraeota bacterium]